MAKMPTLRRGTKIDGDLIATMYRAVDSSYNSFAEDVLDAQWIDGSVIESDTFTEITGWQSEYRMDVAILRATWMAQPINHFAARTHSVTVIQVTGGGRMGGEGYATQDTHIYTSALSDDELLIAVPALAFNLLPRRTVGEEL